MNTTKQEEKMSENPKERMIELIDMARKTGDFGDKVNYLNELEQLILSQVTEKEAKTKARK